MRLLCLPLKFLGERASSTSVSVAIASGPELRLTRFQRDIPAQNIEIATQDRGFDKQRPQYVVLLADTGANACLISSRVANKYLALSHKWGTDPVKQIRALGVSIETAGKITIMWRSKASGKVHLMDCDVVNNEHAPFDVLAGNDYIQNNAELLEAVSPRSLKRNSRFSWRRRSRQLNEKSLR